MLPLWLWLRRSTTTFAFPALIVVEVLVLWSRSGWNHEWDWAFSNATSGAVLITFLLGGLVAFDRARRVEPTLALLGDSASRGTPALLTLPLASWLWALAAWALGMGYAGIRAWRGGAAGLPDPWVFVEAPVLLLTGACVGLAVGTYVKGLLAGPFAVVLLYMLRLYAGSAGLAKAFDAGGAVGSLVGLRRYPDQALAVLGFHLCIAVFAIVLAITGPTHFRRGFLPHVRLAVAGLAVAVSGATLMSTAHGGNYYLRTTAADLCLHDQVTVCGPPEGRYLLTVADRSLSTAMSVLAGSGIDWQTTYVLVSGNPLPADRGVLSILPEEIKDGALSRGDVISTLVQPRSCRDLLPDSPGPPAQRILDDQDRVWQWVTARLDAGTPGVPAPPQVRQAYQRLRSCAPSTLAVP